MVNYSVVMSYIFEDMKFALGSMALILFYLVVSLQVSVRAKRASNTTH